MIMNLSLLLFKSTSIAASHDSSNISTLSLRKDGDRHYLWSDTDLLESHMFI
jgi:hypothetical protein